MIDTNKDMRWMMNNFLEAGMASFSVSSEDTSYPKENLIDGSHRTELFKFGGRFLIEEDVNDKIYINSSTYTIPADDYANMDDLLTAVNALTSAVATFSYVGETRVIEVSDPAGLTLNLSSQTEAAWETLGFTGVVDEVIAADIVFEADEARMHWPYEEINVNFGYQAPLGFVALIGDLGQELRIPEGATVRLQANNVDSFVAPPLDVTIPWYKTGMFRFIDDQDDSAWQYAKIIIECPSGPFIPEIGFLYMGDYQTGGVRNIGTGFELNYEDDSELSSADSGAMYGNSKTPYRTFSSLQYGLVRPDQVAFLKRSYALKQKIVPFFVALDPKNYLSDSADEHLAYVRFSASPRYKHILRNISELSFNLVEAL